eukprot:gene18772-23997_t
MELAKTIGDNVQRLRKERGWTQADMCRHSGSLSQSRLSHIENGEKLLTTKTIQQLAGIFGVEPFELLVDRGREGFQGMSAMLALIQKLPKKERESLS